MTRRNGPIITIDGPAGSGKSTTARLLAQHLGYLYVDTGAMYRAITLQVLRENVNPGDMEAVARIADLCEIQLFYIEGEILVLLDGEDVSDEIRMPEVTLHASAVSEVPQVRKILVAAQRSMGEPGGVVLEGRDTGTVVFPDADLKIFLEADLQTRADRRLRELRDRGREVTVEEVAADLQRRDDHDRGREDSPLQKAADALIIDTTDLTIEEQVEEIEELVRKQIKP